MGKLYGDETLSNIYFLYCNFFGFVSCQVHGSSAVDQLCYVFKTAFFMCNAKSWTSLVKTGLTEESKRQSESKTTVWTA